MKKMKDRCVKVVGNTSIDLGVSHIESNKSKSNLKLARSSSDTLASSIMKDLKNFHPLKDSLKRIEFETGALREPPEGKGRFDLISPIALKRLAQHYENGSKKYADRNWEKGIPLSRTADSLARHLNQFMEGDRSEDHLAAIMWNAAALIHTEEMINRGLLPKELDNLPNYRKKGSTDGNAR